jgi:hypothetical protein
MIGRTIVILIAAALAGTPAAAGESYYVVVFASQRPHDGPSNSHTFATFVHAVMHEPSGKAAVLETLTISWMPETLQVHACRLHPEEGVNLGLHATLDWALANRHRLSYWGPYEITAELFERARRQGDRLASGAERYKTVDTGCLAREVSNCIHAVSDLAYEAPRLRIGSPGWGEAASQFVALSLAPWMIDRAQTHPWVLDALGVADYPLTPHGMDASPLRCPLVWLGREIARCRLRRSGAR